MTSTKDALETIQELYSVQDQIALILHDDAAYKHDLRRARRVARQFDELLKKVEQQKGWQYMGGKDVLEELQVVDAEVQKKVKVQRRRG